MVYTCTAEVVVFNQLFAAVFMGIQISHPVLALSHSGHSLRRLDPLDHMMSLCLIWGGGTTMSFPHVKWLQHGIISNAPRLHFLHTIVKVSSSLLFLIIAILLGRKLYFIVLSACIYLTLMLSIFLPSYWLFTYPLQSPSFNWAVQFCRISLYILEINHFHMQFANIVYPFLGCFVTVDCPLLPKSLNFSPRFLFIAKLDLKRGET